MFFLDWNDDDVLNAVACQCEALVSQREGG